MSDSVVSFEGKQSSLTWPYNYYSGTLFNKTSPDASLAVMQLWLGPSKTCLHLTSWKIYCNKISDPKQQTETSRSYTQKKQYTVLVCLYRNLTNFIKITENHCTRPAQILAHGSFSCNYQLRGWAKLKAPRSRGPTSDQQLLGMVSSQQPTKTTNETIRPSWGLP